MNSFIIDINNYQNSNVGAKAYNLFRMKENGINVPDFFCIDSAYFDNYLNNLPEIKSSIKPERFNDEEYLKSLSLQFKDYINEIKFDEDFIDVIERYICNNYENADLFSVRSSSVVEDGKDSSFAGLFDTVLNVSSGQLFEGIKSCLFSLFSPNVLKYCLERNADINELKMGIIIQKMIPAYISGVAFTANPRGLLNEIIIVAGYGSGDLIVEDKVPTITYYYNITDRNYYYENQPGAPVLDNENLQKIIDAIDNIKVLYDGHLDIEYALYQNNLYILQARPITTLKVDKIIVLDNSNIVESYPNVSLPLTISFAKEAYYGVFRGLAKRCLSNGTLVNKYDHVLKAMVESVNGRMYYQINSWYTLIETLPFSKKIIPVWQDALGISSKEYHAEKVKTGVWQKIKTWFSVIKQFVSVPKQMNSLNEQFIDVSVHFNEKYQDSLSNDELKVLYESISEKVLKNWDITLLNDLYAFVFVGLLKSYFKRIKVPDYEAEVNKYISGITNIESMEPVRKLMELAMLGCDEGVIDDLSDLENDKDLEEYLLNNQSVFSDKFKEYIKMYGDRSLEELKLESHTYRSSPITLVKRIIEYTEDKDKLDSVNQSLNKKENKDLPNIYMKRHSFINRLIVRYISNKAMSGIKNREISRMNRSRIYGMVRTIFLTIGDNLSKSGLIESTNDIFYLTTAEVFDTISGIKLELKNIVDCRKKEYILFRKLPNNSRMIFANRIFDKKHININSEDLLKKPDEISGIPCSNGIVTGEILVVDNPEKADNYRDKILVTKTTDPGWVFLLTLAKGIIAEKGSLLSHTAIISRELNIPSIVGVKDATRILKTGDIIRMNGDTGEIQIEKRESQ